MFFNKQVRGSEGLRRVGHVSAVREMMTDCNCYREHIENLFFTLMNHKSRKDLFHHGCRIRTRGKFKLMMSLVMVLELHTITISEHHTFTVCGQSLLHVAS
jgi:hypothetical protein